MTPSQQKNASGIPSPKLSTDGRTPAPQTVGRKQVDSKTIAKIIASAKAMKKNQRERRASSDASDKPEVTTPELRGEIRDDKSQISLKSATRKTPEAAQEETSPVQPDQAPRGQAPSPDQNAVTPPRKRPLIEKETEGKSRLMDAILHTEYRREVAPDNQERGMKAEEQPQRLKDKVDNL